MAKEYAKDFYNSSAWKKTRMAYISSKFYICEECGKPAEMVHHIVPITPKNISDPKITLSFENLMALCNECHSRKHKAAEIDRRYFFDDDGRIIYPPIF